LRKRVYARLVSVLDALHWLLSRFILRALVKILGDACPVSPSDIRTVFVLRNCFFGDFIVAIPALRRLRGAFPEAEIVFVTASSFAAAWRDRPQADDVFNIEPGLIDRVVRFTPKDLADPSGRASLRSRLAPGANDLAIALCYPSESLLSRLKRVALAKALGLPFPMGLTGTPTLPAPHWLNRWRLHRAEIEHTSAAALGCVEAALDGWGRTSPHGATPTPQRGAVSPRYGRRLVGVAPFTKQPVKQWPLERFKAVMRELASEFDVHFEIYGAPEERAQAAELDALLDGSVSVASLCGALSPLQLRQHMERLDLLVCLDSGPAHVASLVGTPVVAIFPQITLHNFWRPWGPGGRLVSTDVPCAACDTRNGLCPLGTRACIDGVTVAEVIRQARGALCPA
jgi:ADP-heptose:LPS heptosyltransferase